MAGVTELVSLPISKERSDVICVLSLNRPDAANAFNDIVIRELVTSLKAVKDNQRCRALVLRGKGKHFSAGADLAWMKTAARLSYEENIKDARGLIELFEALATQTVPTLGVITGSAFGGAVGLTACCDIAIATEGARFSLSEVKLGLLPAVILPYLARKIRPSTLRRLALTGRVFSAAEAQAIGLLERVVPENDLTAAVREELNDLLQGSPEAQTALKSLLAHVTADSFKQGLHTAEAIAKARTGASGQAGLAAFFDKKAPPWTATLSADWQWDSNGA